MKIVIATGGTGGHIFPAVGVARELKKKGHDLVFFSTEGRGAQHLQRAGFDFVPLELKGLTRFSLTGFIVFVGFMTKAFFRSFRLLKDIRPDVVAGFGGYGSFPVVLAAVWLGYPTLIHEQNVRPGKANYLLGKMVRKVAVSFEQSKQYFLNGKAVLTGCPSHLERREIGRQDLFGKYAFSEDKLTILVLGGSQGSKAVNDCFFESIPLLRKDFDFQIVHLCGNSEYSLLKEKYRSLEISHCLFDFSDEMDELYKIADLVVARAGALTVSELVRFCLPAVLIPYPFAGGHQKENAAILEEAGVAVVRQQRDLSCEKLAEDIKGVLARRLQKEEIAAKVGSLSFSDAGVRVANEIEILKNEK